MPLSDLGRAIVRSRKIWMALVDNYALDPLNVMPAAILDELQSNDGGAMEMFRLTIGIDMLEKLLMRKQLATDPDRIMDRVWHDLQVFYATEQLEMCAELMSLTTEARARQWTVPEVLKDEGLMAHVRALTGATDEVVGAYWSALMANRIVEEQEVSNERMEAKMAEIVEEIKGMQVRELEQIECGDV